MSTDRLREAIRSGADPRLLHRLSVLNSKGSSTPPAPDYTGAAKEQSAASKEIATQQTWANRPEQYTPFGNVNWNSYAATDPSTGQPVTQWQQTQTLSPDLQAALTAQQNATMQRSQLANQFGERVRQDYAQPFDWSNLPGMSETPQAQLSGVYGMQGSVPQYGLDTSAPMQTTQTTNEPGFVGERQRIEQSLFDRMRPEQQFQEDRTRTMLANQGLTPGSEAYNRELGRLGEQQAGERYNAMNLAGQEQQRMQQMLLGQQQQAFGQDTASQQAQNAALQSQFGQGLQAGQFYNQAGGQQYAQELGANQQNFSQMQQMADYQNKLRQQAIAEQAMARGMSLNEMNALMTGQQVTSPQMPGFYSASAGQAPNLLQAAQYGYQGNLDAYNAGQQGSQGLMSGLFGLGGALLGGPAGAAIGTAIGSSFGGGKP